MKTRPLSLIFQPLSIALLILMLAGAAQAVDIENGVPTTIPVDASMDNNFAVIVTDIDVGTLAAMNAIGETAELTITPGGAIDDSNGSGGAKARLISSGSDSHPGTLDIEGALTSQQVTISYSNVRDLTCVSGCTGTPPKLIIAEITDDSGDQAALWSADDPSPDASATPGRFTTSGTGTATVNMGVTLRTDGSGIPYPSGNYEGSFDVILEY